MRFQGDTSKEGKRRLVLPNVRDFSTVTPCLILKKEISYSMYRASYYMAIIIQQDATEYSSFKCVNCSKCFGWYFTHHQELMDLCLHYVAFMRPLL